MDRVDGRTPWRRSEREALGNGMVEGEGGEAKAITRQGVVRGRGVKVIQTTVEPLIEATKRGQLFVRVTDPSRESRVQMWIEAHARPTTVAAYTHARTCRASSISQPFYPSYAPILFEFSTSGEETLSLSLSSEFVLPRFRVHRFANGLSAGRKNGRRLRVKRSTFRFSRATTTIKR